MSIEVLLLEMIERMALACIIGLIFSQTKVFDAIINHRLRKKDHFFFVIIFSAIAIIGTYAGIPVDDALANSRVVGIMASGLIGGPVLGTIVGVIAGIHRYFCGGFTAIPCALSSILEGILAGCVARAFPRASLTWPLAFCIGFFGEVLQMAIILMLGHPFEKAYELVSEIVVPMTIANSFGLAIFMRIVQISMARKDSLLASQSDAILTIAQQSVTHFRKGLRPESAKAVVNIIKAHTSYDAVSMTNTKKVIAFAGVSADHHGPEHSTDLTSITRRALVTGEICLAHTREEIGCNHEDCTLYNAVVVPLRLQENIVGTLKLYYTINNHRVSTADIAFARGLANLFSTQLELSELRRQRQIAEAAKLQALYMQINPHFLFNTLNTIASLMRTNTELARRLLVTFSKLFRFTLQYGGKTISFSQEWEQVDAYITIAQARYGDSLFITSDIEEKVYSFSIPSLTVQPIIENAVVHGLQPRDEGGSIAVRAFTEDKDWIITVQDDGIGFGGDPKAYLSAPQDNHIGLYNVQRRIKSLYGDKYGLSIHSDDEGTTVSIRLPQEDYHDTNAHS